MGAILLCAVVRQRAGCHARPESRVGSVQSVVAAEIVSSEQLVVCRKLMVDLHKVSEYVIGGLEASLLRQNVRGQGGGIKADDQSL